MFWQKWWALQQNRILSSLRWVRTSDLGKAHLFALFHMQHCANCDDIQRRGMDRQLSANLVSVSINPLWTKFCNFFSRKILRLLPLPLQKQDPGTRCKICALLWYACVTIFGSSVFDINLTIWVAYFFVSYVTTYFRSMCYLQLQVTYAVDSSSLFSVNV